MPKRTDIESPQRYLAVCQWNLINENGGSLIHA
jgi:hypothetical protein